MRPLQFGIRNSKILTQCKMLSTFSHVTLRPAAAFSSSDLALPNPRLFSTTNEEWKIKINGEKIDPTQVEMAIMRHPRVTEAAVIGIPEDSDDNDTVKALVVLEDGALKWSKTSARANMSAGEKLGKKLAFDGEVEKLLAEANLEIMPQVEVVQSLPRVDGEIQRDQLRETYANRRPDFISIDDPSSAFDRR